jgi:hypothetical protein
MGYNGTFIIGYRAIEEDLLSRVINPDSVGSERNRLRKQVIITIRAFLSQNGPTDEAKDMAAFIVLALRNIYDTVETSVIAWEKRGYWVKADRFRLEWEWTLSTSNKMEKMLVDERWEDVAGICIQVAQKFYNVNVSPKHRLGIPWTGSWKKLFS